MVKEEIVEGLRLAVSKGESMERAMTTFYNAGYVKNEIEEAAAVAVSQPMGFSRVPQKMPFMGSAPQQTGVVQRVSSYDSGGSPPSKAGMTLTIILVVILLFLIGILAAVVLFREEITSFFTGLTWTLF